jgi:metallophosphoesterase (TIGR00282 family)
VGDAGLEVLEEKLKALKSEYSADFVVVNGENSSGGFGITNETLKRIFDAGADVVTGGNHTWEKRDFWPVLDTEPRALRPANYPAESVGRGWVIVEKDPFNETGQKVKWLVVNLQGREYMTAIDCPFKTFDAIYKEVASESPIPVLVDFHAESTREKESLGFYLDGRCSAVAGTHTHIQTADERVLPAGTAYISDLGMTGVTDSVIGMDAQTCVDRAVHQVLYRMEPAVPGAEGCKIQGVVVEIDSESAKAISISRISV